jgi:crotonobetainyl-CoA:carnitine CoA-transferase CaiB-like acyl-CoA transferase
MSATLAGSYCSKLLSDGGAEVIKVEDLTGDPLRRWSASHQSIPAGADGALFSYLCGSKKSIAIDPRSEPDLKMLQRLLEQADAVVWTGGSRVSEHESCHPSALLARFPGLSIGAISPFGLEGPWKDRAATEFTLQAWSGGIIGLGRGSPDRAPIQVGGRVGEWTAGAFAALGLLFSRLRKGRDGSGEIVDVSIMESCALTLTYYPVTYFDLNKQPLRRERRLPLPGVSAATDGIIGMSCGTLQQRHDLYAMVGHEDWIADDALMTRPDDVEPVLRRWIAARSVADIHQLASAFRIPHATIANGATLPSMDYLEGRNAFVSNPLGFVQPSHPYRLGGSLLRAPAEPPKAGADNGTSFGQRPARASLPSQSPLPLRGLRVLDMTAYWAGPFCTQLLGLMGAEVIHLESASRLDGSRLVSGVSADVAEWWERSYIFLGGNANKKSMTLDFQTDRGQELLRKLVATCDVIVENYTPRVLDQIRLDYDSVRELNPATIMVRLPGFGLDGPWRDAAAFAYVIEDASGLTWMTGYPDQEPVEPYCIADPNAGLHAAIGTLLALEQRRHTGQGTLVEATMVNAALSITAEQVVEYSAYGALLQRDGNHGPAAAPQNLYQTSDLNEFGKDDSWIAIAVSDNQQWAELCAVVGRTDWAANPRMRSVEGRRIHQDQIDEAIGNWCRVRPADEVLAQLWPRGVPVAKVMQPHRQPDLDQLAARAFFEAVDHDVVGRYRCSTLPFTMTNGPERLVRSAPPRLGQHNRELQTELGLDDDEIQTLAADDIIGDSPATPRRRV